MAVLLTSVISSVVYLFVNKKILGYKLRQQLKDIGASALVAVTMSLVCFGVGALCKGILPIWALCLQVLSGAVWYIGLSALLRNPSFTYLIQKIKSLKK